MLVYHFKGRLVLLEQKTNTMFEILSSMIKEMKEIRESTSGLSTKVAGIEVSYNESIKAPSPAFSPSMPFGGGAGGLFPPELFRLFQMGGPQSFQENQYDDDDDDEDGEEGEFKRIVVSDTELDSDDDDDDNDDVRVISVDIENSIVPELGSLDELKEEDIVLDDVESEPEVVEDGDDEIELDDEPYNEVGVEEKSNEDTEQVDYRKLDVSYLRTMVLTRGLATDTKKLKKPDLIRLLEN